MGSLHFVIKGFADIVKQPGALGLLDIHAEFCCDDGRQMSNFNGVLEHVLREAGAELEFPKKVDYFGMKVMNTRVEGRPFTCLPDNIVHFHLDLLDNVLHPPGVNPAVADQSLQRNFRDFPPDGIKTGENNGFRSVIDNQVNACCRFNRPDVAPFSSDDPPFHFITGKTHDRDGVLSHEIAGIPLNGIGQNLPRLLLGIPPRFLLYLSQHGAGFTLCLRLHGLDKIILRLLRGNA